ncbi:hypothetical protein SSCI18S_03968 [Sphingobium scionense]
MIMTLPVQGSYMLGLLLLAAGPVEAAPPARAAIAAEQELIALSRQKWDWMAQRDVARLGALFDDQAVFVHMGGTMTKAAELDVIRSGKIQYKHAQIRTVSVRVINATAILLSDIRLTAIVGGREVVNPFMVTETYVRDNGRWKLGALSFTRLLTD